MTRTSDPGKRRSISRTIHLLMTIPLGALVYAPTDVATTLRVGLQIALFPIAAISGLWLWKGEQTVRRLRRPRHG